MEIMEEWSLYTDDISHSLNVNAKQWMKFSYNSAVYKKEIAMNASTKKMCCGLNCICRHLLLSSLVFDDKAQTEWQSGGCYGHFATLWYQFGDFLLQVGTCGFL